MIHTQIKEDMKQAMKNKEAVKLSVIRGILSAFTNEAVTKGRKPDEPLSDEEALAVIKRQAKQRQDSIKQFTDGGRDDLAEAETEELLIIETYLPAMMSEEDIKKIVESKITEMNITDKSKIGILIGAVMKETGGQADGNQVKKIAEELLS